MITGISIENVNSIKKCEITFAKAKYQYKEEFVLKDKVANPIAIYGANGSGKSSLIKAIGYLVLLLSAEKDKLGAFVPNLADSERKKESKVRIEFEFENTPISYEIATDFDGIVKETLVVGNHAVLIRSRKSYSYDGTHYEIAKGFYPALREVSNNTNNTNMVYKVYDYLSNIAVLYADRSKHCIKSFMQASYMDVMVEKSAEAKKLLREYRSFPIYDIISNTMKTGEKVYSLRIERGASSFELPFELASTGMENQSLLLSILLSLPRNGVLIVDELEAALHPLAIVDFIKATTRRGIQLIFSSHNTNILSKLRPDNVLFAKWKDGNSSYYRLSDIYPNIREVNNIEKMYLSSIFDEEMGK